MTLLSYINHTAGCAVFAVARRADDSGTYICCCLHTSLLIRYYLRWRDICFAARRPAAGHFRGPSPKRGRAHTRDKRALIQLIT
jgi:hypothetical protein